MTRSFWLDVQTSKPDAIRDVLALFPVHPITVEEVIDPESYDNLEAFTALDYVFMNIRCCPVHGGPSSGYGSRSKGLTDAGHDDDFVVCSVICFEDWIITIHASPFVGLAEVVQKMQTEFSHRCHFGRLGWERPALAPSATQLRRCLTPSWVLATLTDAITDSFLPAPTVVLAEVDRVDEMVLLIAPGHRDQADMLRQVELLRRRLSKRRALLFKKEQLLQQLLMPLMRTCFVAQAVDDAKRFKHTLLHLIHVAERLDSARDILNQANMNFMTRLSIQLSQGSVRMDLRTHLLMQVALIFLPLMLVSGIFGMNVRVPFKDGDTLAPFGVIVGGMGAWLVLCLLPVGWEVYRTLRRQAPTVVMHMQAHDTARRPDAQ